MILRCCAARESLCASGSSRPPPPKLPSSVCDTAAYGAWELSSPDSFGGGGRENPLAHRLSQAAPHRSIIV